ncbi:ATP-dependent Clp protease adaptor ClpS [Massilia sp. CCM 8734]|uniref:ATP-dependent Clp protease adaptor ClpS n=1 Tax=Massilia sp. CCM 8734 TaxID=2609283 RepID=UPI0014238A0E|nr:ATP-dependent Clp protease adaptor ClpS [Massilia sp. CCM 8734]NHZ94469.1 hypothetical protein [Massilia sp. CCM 8734]
MNKPCGRYDAVLQNVLQEVLDAAHRAGAPQVSLERMLVHLIEDDSVRAVLAACIPQAGIMTLGDELRAMVAARLAAELARLDRESGRRKRSKAVLPRSMPIGIAWIDAWLDRRAALDPQLSVALRCAVARVSGAGRPADCLAVLVTIVDKTTGAAANALLGRGLDRYELACRVAYGEPTSSAGQENIVPSDSASLALVLLDDDYTTMAFVVEALEAVMAIPTDQAQLMMLRTHREGRVVVAELPAAAARVKSGGFERFGRERCEPLRVRLELPS